MAKTTFRLGSYFHLYNRGVDGRMLFSSQEDFDRFEAYLYLLNGTESPRASNFFAREHVEMAFDVAKGESLVAISAYSILPKRFHLLVTPVAVGGVSKFMQKLQTAYTMYFNDKYMRTGRLFESRYRAQAVQSHDHLAQIFSYVHLSPSELFNVHWKGLEERDMMKAAVSALNYRYTSANEYMEKKFKVTEPDFFPIALRRTNSLAAHLKLWRDTRNVGVIEGE